MFACLAMFADVSIPIPSIDHVFNTTLTFLATALGAYALYRKQMLANASQQVEVDKANVAVSAAKNNADAQKDATASAAWQNLYAEQLKRCDVERAEWRANSAKQDDKIEALQAQMVDHIKGAAERAAQLAILTAQVERLEKDLARAMSPVTPTSEPIVDPKK